jgi:hypothetical protein
VLCGDILPCRIPCRAGYHAAQDTMLCGIPCRAGYHVVRDIMPRGIPCCAGIPCRAGYHVVRDIMPRGNRAGPLGPVSRSRLDFPILSQRSRARPRGGCMPPLPHLRRDWARPLPHLRQDWALRCPHLRRDQIGSCQGPARSAHSTRCQWMRLTHSRSTPGHSRGTLGGSGGRCSSRSALQSTPSTRC